MLRKALEDEAGDSPYIETIPRRGYRFVAETTTGPPQSQPAAAERPARRWIWTLASAGALLTALIYYQFYMPSRYLPRGPRAALAVVPFECLCPGMDAAGFSQGFDEVLVADLARLKGVQVVAPSTVRRHQRMGVSMGLMGRLLGLDVLLEGTIQKLDAGLRITARLVDVHTGRVIWAETYDAPADPAAAEEAVAPAITAETGKRLRSP